MGLRRMGLRLTPATVGGTYSAMEGGRSSVAPFRYAQDRPPDRFSLFGPMKPAPMKPAPVKPAPMKPDEIIARLLYRDALMLILDKPAGLPVHSGPGGGPNLEQAFDALRFGLPKPPALAHRLDRDTSGCLVLGRQRKGLSRLGRLFAEGRIEKTYWAVVEGGPEADAGRIDLPLHKITNRSGWRMVVDARGREAVTDYTVLARFDGLAWLALHPRTGRTHQIRVHCAESGWPLVGDPAYGRAQGGRDGSVAGPLQLHSRAIVVPLYPSRAPIAAVAPPPPHMRTLLQKSGVFEEIAAGAADAAAAPMRAGT